MTHCAMYVAHQLTSCNCQTPVGLLQATFCCKRALGILNPLLIATITSQDEAMRLTDWSKEEAQVKDYIKALADSRNIMRKEHARLQAAQAANIAAAERKAAALAKEEAAPGIPLGFNPIRCALSSGMRDSPLGNMQVCSGWSWRCPARAVQTHHLAFGTSKLYEQGILQGG